MEDVAYLKDIKITFANEKSYIIEAVDIVSGFNDAKKYEPELGEVVIASYATEEDLTNPNILNLSKPS